MGQFVFNASISHTFLLFSYLDENQQRHWPSCPRAQRLLYDTHAQTKLERINAKCKCNLR